MESTADTPKKSTADSPDLDWSQVRETIVMLNLATARIEYCMRDGNESVDTLTNSFTNMAGNVAAIRSALDDVWQQAEVSKELRTTIDMHCEEVNVKMHNVIMAFQFYDKLVQRLAHVSRSMSALAGLVSDPDRLYSPHEWKALQEKIRSQYSMDDEAKMIDAVINGKSIEEVVRLMEEADLEEGDDRVIELF